MFWLLQYGRIFTDSISVSSLVNGVVKGIKGVVRDMMISLYRDIYSWLLMVLRGGLTHGYMVSPI